MLQSFHEQTQGIWPLFPGYWKVSYLTFETYGCSNKTATILVSQCLILAGDTLKTKNSVFYPPPLTPYRVSPSLRWVPSSPPMFSLSSLTSSHPSRASTWDVSYGYSLKIFSTIPRCYLADKVPAGNSVRLIFTCGTIRSGSNRHIFFSLFFIF